MKVHELIALLQNHPPNLLIVYEKWSEQCLLEEDDIKVVNLCYPREDGWVPSSRPGKATQNYLRFP